MCNQGVSTSCWNIYVESLLTFDNISWSAHISRKQTHIPALNGFNSMVYSNFDKTELILNDFKSQFTLNHNDANSRMTNIKDSKV